MVFHAWTEAWIVDRWIPLDATQEEPVALDRIKLRDSALSSENPYELVLPVLELLDSLTVTRLASLE
jgi:transglutaminase-like putative cysteine protease